VNAKTPSPLDVATLRDGFPALARVIHGRKAAYLDGPGGSQMPEVVIEAMASYLRGSNSNLGGAFATSAETDALYARAREAGADFTGSSPDEIAFGANMTTLNFLLAHAVARTLEAGDEILVTELDHDGNVSPWLLVARDFGLVVRTAPLRPEDATLDLDALEALIGSRTRVVAFTLASNAVGSKPDARRIAAAAHRAGALAWGDAVHYAPHGRIDRAGLGLDVVVCSPYKFFGPHLGMAAIRKDLAERWPADRVRPASEHPAGHRFETGTQSHEALAGFVAAVDYLADLGDLGEHATRRARLDAAYTRIVRHEASLSERALRRMSAIPGLRLYGVADLARIAERTPTFTFTIDGMTPRAVAEELGRQGVFVWDGDYYALGAMAALGLEGSGGAVRAGFLLYTTVEEVDRLCDAVEAIADGSG
jgi:cysteine desulfurase family protein (TIGR01976 family)